MYTIFIALAVMLAIVLGICFVAYLLLKNCNNKTSIVVVEHFEPGNIAPELTQMIEYHKKNDLVDYEF